MRLIAGSGRSGTTWVQDALAAANGLRPVFEPLHPEVSETGHLYAYRAIGPHEAHPDLEKFFENAHAGRRHRLWTQFRRQRRWLVPPRANLRTSQDFVRLYYTWRRFIEELPELVSAARKRDPLVKCIRANLMLGWLAQRLGCKTALIVRHPAAVIESELRGGWSGEFALERYRKDAKLHELTQNRYRALLDRDLSPIESLAACWIIENQWPVENASAYGVAVFHYEHLKSSPEREWRRLCKALDLDRVPAADVLARPSQQSAPRRSAAKAAINEPRWIRALSTDQLSAIQRIMDDAGVGLYTIRDSLPRMSADTPQFEGTTRVAS